MFGTPIDWKSYSDKVLGDVVDMDATHVILDKPWQFDNDTIYRGKIEPVHYSG